MNKLSRLISLMVLVAATVAVGLVHGRLSNRWGLGPDIADAGQRLQKAPLAIGDWEAKGDEPLPPTTVKLLQCSAVINRNYQNKRTGDVVSVAVLVGPAGPIAVHTPEICYSSRDYRTLRARERWTLEEAGDSGDELWDLRMQANDVSESRLRIMYGWTNSTKWQATEDPRFAYGGSPYLYKLQLAGPDVVEGQQRDVCREFLAEFLPAIRKHMIDRR